MTETRDEELFLDDDEDQSSAHFKDFAPERVSPTVKDRERLRPAVRESGSATGTPSRHAVDQDDL